jgi:hypothetical protein
MSEQSWVDEKRRNRMAQIDSLPFPLRELVHEYGFSVVKAFVDLGVTKPAHVKHLVNTVLDEFSPTRGSFSKQGITTPMNNVDAR